jgi:hypothetical protein
MILLFLGFLTFLGAFFRSRCNLGLEILALRQQLGVLKRTIARPRLRIQDRIFWILLRRLWTAWSQTLILVKPETVVAWHRAAFRLFWRFGSQAGSRGRPKIDAEPRSLIRRMVKENPAGGGPRIHGELLKLGFEVSERTVSRYMLLPSSIVGPIAGKDYATMGYSQLWLRSIHSSSKWEQVICKKQFRTNHPRLMTEAPCRCRRWAGRSVLVVTYS